VLAVGLLVIAVLVPLLTRRGDGAAIQPAPKPTVTVTATPAPATATAAIGPPAGYVLYRDPTGWSIAVPKAWRAVPAGAAVTFRDGDRVLRVTHRGNPPRDPYAAQLQLEPTVKSKIQGYDFMRIARVPYRDWPTADWEYRAGTEPVMHTVIRSTIPTADQVYDISWTTQDRRWNEDRAFFDTITRTFDPGA
jgi:hypothetical protein